MLRIEDASLAFGGQVILDGVTWQVRDGDRLGLVGANGAGKSTLLRVAAGLQELDGGRRQVTRGQTVGYLAQDGVNDAEGAVFDVVREARRDLVERQRRMDRDLERLAELDADDPRHQALLERLGTDQDAYALRGGYALDAEVGRVLRGLGFARDAWRRPCSSFSRGWQMRIALACLLMQRPSFLLLDEPTNHLDMESRTWLERFLDEVEGAVVVVSHDRHFLDRVVERITEVSRGELAEYRGNYTSYAVESRARLDRITAARARQAREVARAQQFISRYRYDKRRASQVQSRIKALQRMETVEVPREERRVRFTFPASPRSGSPVVRCRELTVGYGDTVVLRGADLSVAPGDRLAVVGPNGAGKSTLLRVMAGRHRPTGGEVVLGHNVLPAYFAQDQLLELDDGRSVLQELEVAYPRASEERLRGVLGAFLFQGDDVHKPVAVLSGGERNRLALAKILVRRANLLLLDEPTNHLDMASKDVLLDALQRYDGTVVFVSHDRAFVTALADRVAEVGGGGIDAIGEGFEDFLWRRAREMGFEGERVDGVPAPDLWLLAPASGDDGRGRSAGDGGGPGESYRERVRRRRAEERRQREIGRLMQRIEELEARVGHLHERMAAPEMATDFEGLAALQSEVDAAEAESAACYERWEQLQD